MDRIDKILRYFDPQRFIEVCEARFDTLRTQVVANLQTKTGSSGKRVNSLGVPEWATGATAASLQTQVEQNDDGFEAAFVGRQGIAGVDGGRSAGDVQAQYASFDAFLLAIERWAQAKEGLYGIEEIDAYAVAANVWSKGTVLYREGGGTEILFDLLQPAVDDIDRQLSEQLDRSVFTMLNETISDYRLTPAISLARNYNTVGVSEAPTYNAAVVKVGGYTLVRSITNGSAVFPMDDLFEIIAQDGNAQTTISLEVDGQAIASSPLYLLKGASARAMTNNAQADTPISWPQPSKIVVFPAFDYSEQILVNSYTGAMQDFAFTDADSGRREVYSRVDPVFSLPMTFFREFGGGERQLIVSTGGTTGAVKSARLTVVVNPCDSGSFVRWRDATGLMRYFLWHPTERVDDVSEDETFETLSEKLTPERHRTITATTTHTLHSGLVDRELFDLCASILSGREVQLYDARRKVWIDAYVEDGDISRTNACMQDCVVELSIKHLTL